MPLKLRHPLKEKKPTVNSISSSPQASQHFSITATLGYSKIHCKSASFDDRSATVCPIDFRSTAVEVSETPAPYETEDNRPEIVFLVTASVTTLFHNRHAKYSKIHCKSASFDDRSAIVCYIDFRSTAVDTVKLRHPMPPRNSTGIITTLHGERHNTFP
jgi:hypothetical protein